MNVNFDIIPNSWISEMYTGGPQGSRIKSFVTIINGYQLLNIVANCSILYTYGSPEYASESGDTFLV